MFNEQTSVILGNIALTEISWNINLDKYHRKNFKRGYLIIASSRPEARLHKLGGNKELFLRKTRKLKYGKKIKNPKLMPTLEYQFDVEIKLNQEYTLTIFDFDEGTAYPAQQDNLNFKETFKLLEFCSNIYSWDISPDKIDLVNSEQTVTVLIKEGVYWDIDYVGIICYT